ncbi:MAG: hypothetical protein DMG79_03205 [Acidobacteria bacterium]|nr:MAG: hypothetical protein DMG79_03205 [Acidobacteriota bacterium]
MMDLQAAKEGRENISTPHEMMTLLDAIYHGKVLNQESTQDFFQMLSTNKDSWIPRDLPADLKIANKPGALEAVRNDSGIVFVEGPVCDLRHDLVPAQRTRRRRSHQQGVVVGLENVRPPKPRHRVWKSGVARKWRALAFGPR